MSQPDSLKDTEFSSEREYSDFTTLSSLLEFLSSIYKNKISAALQWGEVQGRRRRVSKSKLKLNGSLAGLWLTVPILQCKLYHTWCLRCSLKLLLLILLLLLYIFIFAFLCGFPMNLNNASYKW